MKKILALLLVALLALTMFACSKEDTDDSKKEENAGASEELIYENFKYTVNADGNYEITGYVFGGVALAPVTIPNEIDGRPVTGIAADAFKGAQNINAITLPANLLYIGEYAFYDCDYLAEVKIPDSVTVIGKGAFEGCDALTSVTFSKALIQIGDFAFKNCAKLNNFALSEGLIAIGAGAFDGCKALTEVTIPTTVIYIGDTAFYGCSNLATVTANELITAADVAILEKMNATLAAYETEKQEVPATAADAFEILEKAGLFVGGENANGIKFVWDKEAKQIIGSFSTADADLIIKLNAALANAKETPEDMYKLEALFTAAGLNIDSLNAEINSSKYQWNAETHRMERTYTIGSVVFHAAKDGLVVNTTENSPMASYADEFYTVSFPVPAQ